MDIFQGFILGIVQGLTEFLPVSSSGHLVFFQKLFGLENDMLSFDVAVHLATLIAVLIVFKRDIVEIIRKPFSKLPLLILAGTIPTIIIGLIFKDLAESLVHSGISLGFEFILTGLILWYAENMGSKNKNLSTTTYTDASIIGVAQGIAAVLPAVSRSGFTIASALYRGVGREFAARFSFLVSVPAILGATMLDVLKVAKGEGTHPDLGPLLIGMVAAGISGYFAVRFMLKIITKGKLRIFSYYVFILGALILMDQLLFHKFFGKFF